MSTSLIYLRAEVAERAEDTRIARKHVTEAGERTWTPENAAAYERACRWLMVCNERESSARGICIRASLREGRAA